MNVNQFITGSTYSHEKINTAFCDEKCISIPGHLVYFILFILKNVNIFFISLILQYSVLGFVSLFILYFMFDCVHAVTTDMYTMFMSGAAISGMVL